MKKALFILIVSIVATTTHAHVATNPCGGRFFASGVSVNKQGLLDYLSGEGPEIMAPGISKLFWLRCFVANFNQTAGKELGESLLDSQGRISGDAVLAVLEASVEVQVSWQKGQVNSTYPCLERDTYVPFARANYPGEKVLIYKGQIILSFVCGNPLQDFRKKASQGGEEMDFIARSGTYTVPGGPVIINLKVEGSTISNSGNSGDATAFSVGEGRRAEQPKQPAEENLGVFTPGYNPPAPPQYVPNNQGQPTYVANNAQQPYYTAGSAPVATKPNGVEIAGLVVGGSHLVYDVLMDWIPGSPRRRTNNFFYYGGGGQNPTPPAGNGFVSNGTGSFNNPFNTGGGFSANGTGWQ